MQRTVALSTNPFDPDARMLPTVPQGLADGLGGNPMRVDLAPELAPLVCWQLGNLQELDREIGERLFESVDTGRDSVRRQGIIIIEGSKGSGKTTFASHLRRRLLDTGPPGGGQWQNVIGSYPYDIDSPRDAESQMRALREQIKREVQPGANASLLAMIDDLPRDGFRFLLELYEAFSNYFRIFLITKEADPPLGDEILWARPWARVIRMQNLSHEDVRKYVMQRVKHFRMPPGTQVSNASVLFPFEPDYAQKAIGDGSVPLRVINRQFGDALIAHHRELSRQQGFDVTRVPPAELPKYLIKWSD